MAVDVRLYQTAHANLTPGHNFYIDSIQPAWSDNILSSSLRPTLLPRYVWTTVGGTNTWTRTSGSTVSFDSIDDVVCDGMLFPVYWNTKNGKGSGSRRGAPNSLGAQRNYLSYWDGGFSVSIKNENDYRRYQLKYNGQTYTVDVRAYWRGGSSSLSYRRLSRHEIRCYAPNGEIFAGLLTDRNNGALSSWHTADLGRERILGVPSDGVWYKVDSNTDGGMNHNFLKILSKPVLPNGTNWLWSTKA